MSDRAIVGIAGCLAIAVACFSTNSGAPLWALLAVGLIMEAMS